MHASYCRRVDALAASSSGTRCSFSLRARHHSQCHCQCQCQASCTLRWLAVTPTISQAELPIRVAIEQSSAPSPEDASRWQTFAECTNGVPSSSACACPAWQCHAASLAAHRTLLHLQIALLERMSRLHSEAATSTYCPCAWPHSLWCSTGHVHGGTVMHLLCMHACPLAASWLKASKQALLTGNVHA